MRRISLFIISLFGMAALAQDAEKPADTIAKKDRYGLRVGADLYKLARSVYDKDYQGIELVGDFRVSKKFYVAAELGNEKKTTDEPNLNFTTSGTFIKVGFDYNTYENWLDMENMIYVGLRYGVSSFSQELNSYRIYNANPYFDETVTFTPGTEYKGLTASWAEAVAGVKVEVFNNLYVGFSARLYILVSDKKPDGFDNLYIPGFNRTYEGSFGVGFNYTVSYFIPLFKN